MKNILTKIAAVTAMTATLSIALCHSAQAISFNFNWQGNNGYTATGMFGYDETTAPAIISESGNGPTQALDFLMVSFFDPANNPLQSYNTVAGGVSESPFFNFNFDTLTETLFGAFDVGGGTFVVGEQFLQGTIGGLLELRQDIDQVSPSTVLDENSGMITVTAKTPEPSFIFGLVALSALGGGSILKKKVA